MAISNVSASATDAAAYLAYVQDYSMDLLTRGFFQGRTLEQVMVHPGVAGRLTLTQLEIGTLGRRYAEDFAPPSGTINFKPRTLTVEQAKFELRFVPQRFRSSYLGAMQQRAFNGLSQIPFEAFVMNKVMEKQNQEISQALWQGVAAVSPASTDNLSALFDGFLKLITADLAAGTPKLVPVATPGGAWTVDNIIETLEAMWLTLDSTVQNEEVGVFMSTKLWQMYQQAYRKANGFAVVTEADKRIKMDFGLNLVLLPTPEMGTTDRVVMTPMKNLHVGYDDSVLNPAFNFEQDHRAFDYWYDFQFGVQFGFLEAGVVAVNDLA